MLKKKAQNLFFDKLHRGSVWICMGLTVLSGAILAKRGYDYFTQDKPELQRMKEIHEKELLSEGSVDKILLKDNAPHLKM